MRFTIPLCGSAAIEVHQELGHGFLEAVYQEALEFELQERKIPFESQKSLRISYKGKLLQKEYATDLICYNQIIVELKALDQLTSRGEAQVLNYLKATGLRLGLLINLWSHGNRAISLSQCENVGCYNARPDPLGFYHPETKPKWHLNPRP